MRRRLRHMSLLVLAIGMLMLYLTLFFGLASEGIASSRGWGGRVIQVLGYLLPVFIIFHLLYVLRHRLNRQRNMEVEEELAPRPRIQSGPDVV